MTTDTIKALSEYASVKRNDYAAFIAVKALRDPATGLAAMPN